MYLFIWNGSGLEVTLFLYCFTHHDYRICHLTAISNMPIYHPVEHQLLHNYRIGSESSRDHEELHEESNNWEVTLIDCLSEI